MKRKFKLFATLASLCLSVALMAFGVYAATVSTYHVTSTVSYVSQLKVRWNGSYKIGAQEAVNDTEHAVDPLNSDAEAAFTWAMADALVMTAADNYIVYTFTCLNDGGTGADSIYVSAVSTKLFADSNLKVYYQASSNADGAVAKGDLATPMATKALTASDTEFQIPTGKTFTLVIKVEVDNLSKSIAGAESDNVKLDLTLTAQKVAAAG